MVRTFKSRELQSATDAVELYVTSTGSVFDNGRMELEVEARASSVAETQGLPGGEEPVDSVGEEYGNEIGKGKEHKEDGL
jgi:hypothetical protein